MCARCVALCGTAPLRMRARAPARLRVLPSARLLRILRVQKNPCVLRNRIHHMQSAHILENLCDFRTHGFTRGTPLHLLWATSCSVFLPSRIARGDLVKQSNVKAQPRPTQMHLDQPFPLRAGPVTGGGSPKGFRRTRPTLLHPWSLFSPCLFPWTLHAIPVPCFSARGTSSQRLQDSLSAPARRVARRVARRRVAAALRRRVARARVRAHTQHGACVALSCSRACCQRPGAPPQALRDPRRREDPTIFGKQSARGRMCNVSV